MKHRILIFIFLLFVGALHAQDRQLSGLVTDQQGNPIPFASVFIAKSNQGTSANSEGIFTLTLPAGEQELTTTSVGYKPKKVLIAIRQEGTFTVQLEDEAYTLQEVVIGKGENPANAIIRKAIKKRSEYLRESGPYTAHVYIKGLQRLLKAPKKFFGVNIDEVGQEMGLDSNRRGIVYLSESESNITVNPPKEFKEEMVSSKVSGSNRAFSFNRASELQLNFYENHQYIIEGLSSRPFVSPIADRAFAYYRYQYLGSSEEDGVTINKIRVIPKRKAEPLYQGDIYIVEDEWRIHSVNLMVDKNANINFVDSLNIRQLYMPIGQDKWMPTNLQLDFKGGLLGFEIGGYFTAIYQDYTLLNHLNRREFKEVLRIEKDVNKKEANYWSLNRPIPLTIEESKDYTRKDSIRARHESKAYLDSLDRKNNRFKPLGFLLGGYQYRNRFKKENFTLGSPLTSLLFNSVEGVTTNYRVGYSREIDSTSNRYFRLNGHVRYGFSSKRLHANANVFIPIKKHVLTLSGGSDVVDLNQRGSLPVLFNTVNTLFMGQNYQKLYEKTFAHVAWNSTLPGNVRMDVDFEWASRKALNNTSDYTFWNRNKDRLTSNHPFQHNEDRPLFEKNQSSRLSLGLSYGFSNRYETYPTGKRYLPSGYPTLSLRYTQGIDKILGSEVDYSLLSASLYKSKLGLGLYGTFSFAVSAGKFLNNKKLFYPDYKHFNGNKITFVDQYLSSFLNLDYYKYSTPTSFVEAHTEYNMSGILTSKIPLLRKLKLEELIGLHYLSTPEIKQYGELHLGLQWKMLRVMYSHSRSDRADLNNVNTVRVGIKLF